MAPLRSLATFALLVSMISTNTAAEPFSRPGIYSLDKAGWQRNATPSGDVFTCSVCDTQIQVQIELGPPLTQGAPFRTNQQFLARLKTPEQQKAFAAQTVRSAIPIQSGYSMSIDRTGLTKLGGLEAFQFSATVKLGPNVTRDTTMLLVHKERVVKVTLNYYDGALNDKTRAAINAFYASLKFL